METKRAPDDAVILVAEDVENDIVLIRRAFERARIKNPLLVVRDGEEVVRYLEGAGRFSNREQYPFPDLLLLDLKMPRMDGFEVLQWIRDHSQFKKLRVVVLTSSQDIYDVNKAYQMGASSFLVKPLEFDNYTALATTMARFWLEYSRTPSYETYDTPAKSSHENI